MAFIQSNMGKIGYFRLKMLTGWCCRKVSCIKLGDERVPCATLRLAVWRKGEHKTKCSLKNVEYEIAVGVLSRGSSCRTNKLRRRNLHWPRLQKKKLGDVERWRKSEILAVRPQEGSEGGPRPALLSTAGPSTRHRYIFFSSLSLLFSPISCFSFQRRKINWKDSSL